MKSLVTKKKSFLQLVSDRSFPIMSYKMASILAELDWNSIGGERFQATALKYLDAYNRGAPISVRLKLENTEELIENVALVELYFEFLGMEVRTYAHEHKDRCYHVYDTITILSSGHTFDWKSPHSKNFREANSCHGNISVPRTIRLKINKLKKQMKQVNYLLETK